MDIMMIFDVVMMIFGIYVIFIAFRMKGKREIGNVILTEEELKNCKDKDGFIQYMSPKAMVLGIALVVYGGTGLLDVFIWKIGGWLDYIPVIIFLLAFAWFYTGLQRARERYLK